jgi:hypothetical protein
VLAAALGGAFCLWSYGTSILDGREIDWLMAGDRAQSFLGWHFYRHASESFPLGAIPDLLYPVGSSLAYSDAHPWFSIALKPLSPHMPATWQISGPWLVLSYALLGWFAFLVLQALLDDARVAVLGSVLIVMSPVLTRRGVHLSLCAQWLLLAAFLLVLRARGDRSLLRFVAPWSALLVIACATHPYLAMMVMVIGLAACASGTPLCRLRLADDARRAVGTRWPALLALRAAVLLLVAAVTFVAFGYASGPSAVAGGFGTHSANLLTLIDAQGGSRLLPALPALRGQSEGYGFLGTGALALLLVAALARLAAPIAGRAAPAPGTRGELRLLALAVVAMALFALATTILLGTSEVATARRLYAWLEPLPSIFRASGRFVWPLHYALLVAAVVWLARALPPRAAALVLVAAIALQAWDGAADYTASDARAQGKRTYWKALRSPIWAAAGDDHDEIRLIPPNINDTPCPGDNYPRHFSIPFAYQAGRQAMRINSGHLSRQPRAALAAACTMTADEVAVGRIDPRVVYVVSDDALPGFTAERLGLATCGQLDGFNVCTSTARRTRFATLVPARLRPPGSCADVLARAARRTKAPANE